MSYLVDALKKAERERFASQAQDIHTLSTGASAAARSARAGSPWLWLVAILVASNVALAIYVWRPRPAESGLSVPPMTTRLALADAGQPAGLTPGRARPVADPSPALPQPVTSSQRQRLAQNTAQAAMPSSTAAADNEAPARPSAADERSQQGGVTYSKVPLTGDGAHAITTATAAADNEGIALEASDSRDETDAPDQSEVDGVPSVDINGQLYSTVPGRSFILVNGRRYHEGERLAAGPAVESIGPNGATLRYHGQRYHVAGPS